MRKLTLEFIPNDLVRETNKPIFETVQSYKIMDVLRIDYDDYYYIGVMKCTTKFECPIEDVKFPIIMEILHLLKSEGNKHTCVVKIIGLKQYWHEVEEAEMNIIWTTPLIFTEDLRTLSVIGDQESISKFIELTKNYGEIVNMSFHKAAYREHDIISVLTDKQREILLAAYKYGYYEYPKRIQSKKLSQKINISKSTLLEHLRKAEGRILSNILAGY